MKEEEDRSDSSIRLRVRNYALNYVRTSETKYVIHSSSSTHLKLGFCKQNWETHIYLSPFRHEETNNTYTSIKYSHSQP